MGEGKDHWPIGSYVVLEKNQPWMNRVVGETYGLYFAKKINPMMLTVLPHAGVLGSCLDCQC